MDLFEGICYNSNKNELCIKDIFFVVAYDFSIKGKYLIKVDGFNF